MGLDAGVATGIDAGIGADASMGGVGGVVLVCKRSSPDVNYLSQGKSTK